MGSGAQQKAYDGTATFGRLYGYFNFFIGFIFFIVIMIIGYWFYNSEDVYEKNYVKGTILKDSSCNMVQEKNNKTYDCSLNIQYNIDNTEYLKKNFLIYDSGKKYYPSDIIDLRYSNKDKYDITNRLWTNKSIGSIIMIIALIILICISINLYLVRNSKEYAAATGTAFLAGTVTSSISSAWNSD